MAKLTSWCLIFKLLLPGAEVTPLVGVTGTERTCVWTILLSCGTVSCLGTPLIPAEIASECDLRLPPVSFVLFQVIFPWKVNRRHLGCVSCLWVHVCGLAGCAGFVCRYWPVCFAQLGPEECLAVEVRPLLCVVGYFWIYISVCDSQAEMNDWETLQMNGGVCFLLLL